MSYELIGRPRVEYAHCDEWETVMVCTVRRDDGATGDVWIVAGVPDSQQGSSQAAGTQHGYERVRVFGDTPCTWCPDRFRDAATADGDDSTDYDDIARDVVDAVEGVALRIHYRRMMACR